MASLRTDLYTLASSRCDSWNRRARLQLQERISDALLQSPEGSTHDDETTSTAKEILTKLDSTTLTPTSAARLVAVYTQLLLECLKTTTEENENNDQSFWACRLVECLGLSGQIALLRTTVRELQKSANRFDWYQLAKSNADTDNDENCLTQLAAIGVGHGLAADQSNNWITLLLECALELGKGGSFPKDLTMVQDVIRAVAPSSTEQQEISTALLGKAKSHTSKVLPTATAWVSHLDLEISGSGEEWPNLVSKQLIAPKDTTRTEFGALVAAWGRPLAWADALATRLSSQAAVAPPARLDLYQLLRTLANNAAAKPRTEESGAVACRVLDGLLVPLVKKEKTDAAKVPGLLSLLTWLTLVPRKERSQQKAALELIRNAWTGKPVVDSCARPILAHLTASNNSNNKEQQQQQLPVETLEAMLEKDGIVTNSKSAGDVALKAWATAASTKKTLHSEGLSAIYLQLLACKVRKEEVPAWVHEAVKPPSSFLYSPSANQANKAPLVCTLAQYVQLAAQREASETFTNIFKGNAAAQALAQCMATTEPDTESLQTILLYRPDIAKSLSMALEQRVALDCQAHEEAVIAVNATRAARETESTHNPSAPRGLYFVHSGIRRAAMLLSDKMDIGKSGGSADEASSTIRVWRLLHVGASGRSSGRQRKALIEKMLVFLKKNAGAQPATNKETIATWAEELSGVCENEFWQSATTSLLTTIGIIGGMFVASLARELCVAVGSRLGERLRKSVDEVMSMTEDQVGIFRSQTGTLFEAPAKGSSIHTTKTNKNLTEDEVWELEVKKELAKKTQPTTELTAEQKNRVATQDKERIELKALVSRFQQVLNTIRYLVSSDIEVGNECLSDLAEPVIWTAVARCPALSLSFLYREASETLAALAGAVFEVEESAAPSISAALVASCVSTKDQLTIVHLPSPCPEAASVISEVSAYGDVLTPGSFKLLCPVFQAVVKGPRSTPGCEAVLEVVQKHAELFTSDPVVSPLRKSVIISLLELLQHDRAQVFQKPTAVEALVACCTTEDSKTLSPAEMAPLLDERGALGTMGTRKASMVVLGRIASVHSKAIKSNPLVENRIWLNCFETRDEDVKLEARRAWRTAHGLDADGEDALPSPSGLFAPPLIPLLNHKDASISAAAAIAYAKALSLHPSSVSRNIENLCKTYIDAFPTSEAPSNAPTGKTKIPAPPPVKKKAPLAMAPKKRPTAKKSALAVAGIGKPKSMKKKAVSSALLKPKQERTLDRAALEKQFVGASNAKKEEQKDTEESIGTRLGVLRAIAATKDIDTKLDLDEDALKQLTSFLMAYGIADPNDTVKGVARNTLRDIVASNGDTDAAIAFLLPHLESVLKTGIASEESLGSLPVEKVPRDVAASDRRKEGAVVALGSVAIHLKGSENSSKVDSTLDMLLAALKTPSEDVQISVADALTKLMKKGNTQSRIEGILKSLLNDCLTGSSLAARRGAAYGISAAIKGSGIAALKKYEIVKTLEESCASGDSNSKEGSLFAIELLCGRLGLLFEPYVIVLLPSLLKSFSDASDHVRTAASCTTGLIMSKLSAHGVKLVMPAVLKSFEDPAWRTKQASIHMLGAMSHLAPKQLASALPKVVPRLTDAFGDTHPKVKQSAQEALNEISTVIRNPEVSTISAVLLKALTDPADKTVDALESLIETEFLHAIDAPSLALIVPILHRGLRDRGASTKRYGGLIAGNICTMINDEKDFVPYLPTLLPDLQSCLLDPIPDVRSTSAKALGSLTRSLGEYIVTELRPWLLQKLRDTECSSAERSGAAQGLTEVLVASGSEVVDSTMRNELLPLRSYPEASTREGVIWMLAFLPPAMGPGFTGLIDASLPALINGLSDDSEPVRDVSMRAGRVLIRTHGKAHVDKILPSLEVGLDDEDYRIRHASLSLLGDLLSTIGGTTVVKGDGNTQDDIRRAERAQAQIALALGSDTRRRVYSRLYFARSDNTHSVRAKAIQVWKTVVSVTVRTLRDILPVLVNHIIENLASGDEERTEIAGKCLGDTVGKLGETVLPQIMPVLRKALTTGDGHTKRGVCVGLTEIINSSSKEQIVRFLESIVRVVQEALSDADDEVRRMAATSFQSLYSLVGNRAFDEVVPSLMVALDSEAADDTRRVQALNGLTGILSIRSRELLPYIIPRLIQRPITHHHAKALASISEVTGETISSHFSSIIPSLICELSDNEDDAVRDCVNSICSSVSTEGLNRLVSEAVSECGSDKAPRRRESCRMVQAIIVQRAEVGDFYEQIPVFLRELLYRLNDEDKSVLQATHAALSALAKHVPAEELVNHVEFIRNLLASMVSESRRRKGGVGDGEFFLPGFSMPKGVEPLLPIYQRGILYGSSTIREASASGLGEILAITPSKFLVGPLIIKMTGPLLRVVGDRNPSNVKIAILSTLGLILNKGGPALRAFVPQFQTTFVKALSDPSRQVRVEAISALSLLMPLSTRVDPLIKELVAGSLGKASLVEGVGAAAVQTATLQALAVVLEKGGSKCKLPTSVPSAKEASEELLGAADEGIRKAAAAVLGQACSLMEPEAGTETLDNLISQLDSSPLRHGTACAIWYILASPAGESVSDVDALRETVSNLLDDESSTVREAACVALGAVIGRSNERRAAFKAQETTFAKLLDKSESMEIHQAVARGLCVALLLTDTDARVENMGLSLIDNCLQQALSGSQRVQFAFNDVLWLVLDVPAGTQGLDAYTSKAVFDNQRKMSSLHSKVLTRIKKVTVLDD